MATTSAAPKLSADNPLGFFTNAASAFFKQSNFRDNNGNLITVTNIPVWPLTNNNFYTPAVHRLLQVAANIFECTTTNLYPCIYRPRFVSDGTNISICDYELVNGPDNDPTSPIFLTIPLDLNDPAARATIGTNTTSQNFYGVPWIIGARKGFPNLNQIAMQSVSQMTRKLLVYRPLTRSSWTGYQGKQMFVIGVSNSLAVEVWNSYNTDYPRALYIQADFSTTVQITNDAGINFITRFSSFGTGAGGTNLPAGTLLGTGLQPPLSQASRQPVPQSFVVPLQTNMIALPDSVQIAGGMTLFNDSTALWNVLPWNNLFDAHWGMNITTNNLRCLVMDGGLGGRVVDYVQIAGLSTTRDLTLETLYSDNSLGVWTRTPNTTGLFWATPGTMSQGVLQQLLISMGAITTSDKDWADNGIQLFGSARSAAMFNFVTFMTAATVASNFIQAPFTPSAKFRQMLRWEANDPLVHYLQEDLTNTTIFSGPVLVPFTTLNKMPNVTSNMYRLNDRFSPWGGYGPKTAWFDFATDPHMFDIALKDPLVMISDNWNFPSNQPLNFSWLGRVHRGTPWQTLYLKSANILSTDFSAWKTWSGSGNSFLATNSAPINDWRLLSCLNSLLNTNDQRQLLSVSNPDTNAWQRTLDGFTVFTNSSSDFTLASVVVSSNSSQAAVIANGINYARANQNNSLFRNVSDILGTPELSDTSPFLNTGILPQVYAGGITDEALEAIPSQLLPLLRLDSIGSVNIANGQLLVQFTGDANFSYAVEASSNLVDWTGISTNVPANGMFLFTDPTPLNAGPRFYRSVLLP